jgi:hypothetical protein
MTMQPVRPGLTGSVGLQIADTTVATLNQSAIPLASFATGSQTAGITAVNGGATQVAITQPAGFIQPTGTGPLRLTVTPPSISFQVGAISRNAQATLQFSLTNWPAAAPLPAVTLTSSDPTRLLLSTSSQSLGAASVTVSSGNASGYPAYSVYMNALDGPADVVVTGTAAGVATSTAIVPIGSTALGFGQYGSGSSITTDTQVTVAMNLYPVAVNGAGAVSGNVTLRPGLDSIPVKINSSNSSVATVPTSPILNSLTSSSPFTVQPLAAGQTDLTVSPPPGYLMAPPNYGRSAHLVVTGSSFAIADFTLGQDLETQANLTVVNGANTIPSDVDVTLVSGNPSAVLLSADAVTPGAASLTVHFSQGTSPSRPVFVQALEQSGKVAIAITANGYVPTSTNVTVVPTAFTLSQTSISTTLQNSPYTLRMTALPAASGPIYGPFQFRPGMTGPTVSAASSNPAVATISPASAVWPAGAKELDFTVQPVSPGSASLTFAVPGVYTAPSAVSVTVSGGNLSVSPTSMNLGNGLQDVISVYSGQSAVQVTVTSSDPSRLLVSNSAAVAGQASIVATNQAGYNAPIYVQALSASGSVTLTFAAAGFQTATATVQLVQPAVEISSPQLGTLTPLSAAIAFQAHLVTFNPSASSLSYSTATLRPGAPPVVVQPSLSNPAVGTIAPAQLIFNPGDSTQSFSFQPAAPGSALLTLSVPAGFADPVALRQQLITVVAARVSFGSALAVGKDLVSSNYVVLPSSAGNSVTVTVTSADPSRLLLANTANPGGVASLAIPIAPGATTSSPFNLIGLDSGGSVGLTAAAGGLTPESFTVTLQPSGFVFGAFPTGPAVNSTIAVTIFPNALDPQTLAPLGNFVLRPGMAPVQVTVTSSNTAVIDNPAAIVVNAGDSSDHTTVKAKASGVTTLTIQTPSGFSTPSSGATATITVH